MLMCRQESKYITKIFSQKIYDVLYWLYIYLSSLMDEEFEVSVGVKWSVDIINPTML